MKRNWRREMPNIQFKTHPISATAHRGMVGIFITANYYYPPIGRSADYCRCLPRASTHQNHNLRSQRALLPSSALPPPTGTQRVRRYLQRGHHFEVRGMECSMIVYNKRRQKNVRIGERSQRASNFIPIQYLQRETFDLPSPQTARGRRCCNSIRHSERQHCCWSLFHSQSIANEIGSYEMNANLYGSMVIRSEALSSLYSILSSLDPP